ncbi:MAG: PaaI family thioesterase [Thermodesulforhabdaceae bacterium]
MTKAVIEERMSRIPAAAFLGMKLVEISEGLAVLELPFRPEFCNSLGNIQGGFVTALADAAGGVALYTLHPPKHAAPTISLNINFLEPARNTLRAHGRVLRCGSSVGTSFIEVFDSNESLVAVALASYRIFTSKKAI